MKIFLFLSILFGIQMTAHSQAIIPFSFLNIKSSKLNFSTSAQSIFASNCSGIVTVQTMNASNVVTNVSSNLTINLSAIPASITFYSDSSCTTSINSLTVSTGTSSASFYFIGSSNGNHTITATASGYIEVSQTETISTNPFIWTGGGANANWSTAANWSGGVAPGATNVAVFDNTCSSNCSPSINSNISVGGIRLNSGYTGTITQASGFTITTNNSGWVQLSGTFVGGDSNINLYGVAKIVGGNFTTTSGTLTFHNAFSQANSPSINFNLGTVIFRDHLITSSPLTFNNLSFDFWAGSHTLNNTLTVNGTFAAYSNGCGGGTGYLNGGTIIALGTVSNSGGCNGIYGTTLIKVAGSTDQNISGTNGYFFPNIEVASTGGTVTISGSMIFTGTFKYTSGTLSTTGSTVEFAGSIDSTAPLTFDTVKINHQSVSYTLNNDLIVNGPLSFVNSVCGGGNAYLNGGAIKALGNIAISGSCGTPGGTTILKIQGSSSQTLTTTSNYSIYLALQINSTGGTVDITGSAQVRNGLTINSGAVQLVGATDSLTTNSMALNGNTLTRNGGSVIVNSVTVPAGTQSLYGGTIAP